MVARKRLRFTLYEHELLCFLSVSFLRNFTFLIVRIMDSRPVAGSISMTLSLQARFREIGSSNLPSFQRKIYRWLGLSWFDRLSSKPNHTPKIPAETGATCLHPHRVEFKHADIYWGNTRDWWFSVTTKLLHFEIWDGFWRTSLSWLDFPACRQTCRLVREWLSLSLKF